MKNARGPVETGGMPDRAGEACADDASLRARRTLRPAGPRSSQDATGPLPAGNGHDAGIAAYIAVMAADDMLGYLLEMAQLEAGECERPHL